MNWLRVLLLVVGVLALIPLAIGGWIVGSAFMGQAGALGGMVCGFGAGLVFLVLAAVAKG